MITKNSKKINPIIIFGSSRNRGNTWEAIQMILQNQVVPIINLNNLNISAFDYQYKNQEDDFLPLAKEMVKHDPIILATPIYWYSMSAVMKTFIDRWSDFTTHIKDIGRQIRGKTLYIITSYYVYPEGKNGFELIFKQIAKYMGMQYGGCFFHYSGEDVSISQKNEKKAVKFAEKILSGDL